MCLKIIINLNQELTSIYKKFNVILLAINRTIIHSYYHKFKNNNYLEMNNIIFIYSSYDNI